MSVIPLFAIIAGVFGTVTVWQPHEVSLESLPLHSRLLRTLFRSYGVSRNATRCTTVCVSATRALFKQQCFRIGRSNTWSSTCTTVRC